MSSKRKADVHPAAARLAAVAETAKKRGRKPAPAKVIQLPLWPEPKRGAPNAVLRGALFAAVQGKGRIAMDRELSWPPRTASPSVIPAGSSPNPILTCGSRRSTWPGRRPSGRVLFHRAKGFLKALGRQARQERSRLAQVVSGSLSWLRPSKSPTGAGPISAALMERGLPRRGDGPVCRGDQPQARAVLRPRPVDADRLGAAPTAAIGKPLALWLHGFYATHAAPHALTVEYLHKLSGSQTKQLRKFKENLTQALRDLEAAGAIQGFTIRMTTWFMSRPCRARASSATWPRAGRQLVGGNRRDIRGTLSVISEVRLA